MSSAVSRAHLSGTGREPEQQTKRSVPIVIALVVLVLAMVLLAVWIANWTTDIDSVYGRRSGIIGGKSVNGTAVLAKMFEQAGHRVTASSWLTPSLQRKADVVVWFPDDFQPPGDEVSDWFDTWLGDKPDRTLMYVGRDFDAAPVYWKKLRTRASGEELQEIKRRRFKTSADYTSRRSAMPALEEFDWFTIQGASNPRNVRSLSGEPDWLSGIDASKVEIELDGRLVPPNDAQILLASEGDALVSRFEWRDGQVIVVANGSFLLNLPLVNHQHRKLAAKLVDEVGSQRRVVFLESGAGGPPVFDHDPAASQRTGLEVLTVPPLDWILLHLAALGVILCFARWPIFGPARPQERGRPSDFGKHVRALGRLLESTRDRAYATTRLEHYQQTVRHEAAGSRQTAVRGKTGARRPLPNHQQPPAADTDQPG